MSRRPILILRAGDALEPVRAERGDFPRWIREAAGDAWDGEWREHDVRTEDPLPPVKDAAAWVVTGSSSSVTERAPWMLRTEDYVRSGVAAGVPILGLCFGHQIVAQALGGSVAKSPRGRELGTVMLEREPHAEKDPLFAALPASFEVNASHVDSVVRLPGGAKVLAKTALEPVAAYAVGERTWGVQFHPEFDGDAVRGYVRARVEVMRAEGRAAERARAGAADTPQGREVLRNFLRWLGAASLLVSSTFACSTSNSASPEGGTADASRADVAREARATDGPSEASIDAGAPRLLALSVTESPGHAGAGVSLLPPFSPTTFDYSVRCPAGPLSLEVSMTASPGSKSFLSQPMRSGEATSQTVTRSVKANDALVAAATDGKTTTEYWVRCLPSDFPTIQWNPRVPVSELEGSYYLIGSSQPTSGPGYAMILDGQGVPVWYKAAPSGSGIYNVDNILDGAVSFMPFPGGLHPYEVQHLDPRSTALVHPDGLFDNEHELQVLPNGDYLVFVYVFTSGVDLTGMKVTLPDGGVEMPGAGSDIQDCEVVEFDPSGKIVWKWLATDHLNPVLASTWPQLSTATLPQADGGPVYDVFHFNSIDVDPVTGDLLVSARHMDSVFYVEKSSKKILWKLGGSVATKDHAAYIPVADPFYRQHDGRLLPGWVQDCNGGKGQVSVFDDHTAVPGPARAVVYDVDTSAADAGSPSDCGARLDAGDAGLPAAKVAWQYEAEATASGGLGSFRIESDGTRIIGWGGGQAGRVFTVVDAAGHELLDVHFDNVSYRAIEVAKSAFALDVLRHTSGLP
jgi:GMP synthase (glutamine-hydrolysing)